MWLLTIRGPSVWRLCSALDAVSLVDSITGKSYTFLPGLEDPKPEERAESIDGIEIPISVILPVDAWESLTSSDPCGWTAEVAWVADTQTAYNMREVFASGRVDSPVYATSIDAVQFSVIENPWEDRSIFPLPGQQIGADTWPRSGSAVLPEGSIGIWYSWVFGAPGVVTASDGFSDFHGWPAPIVELDPSTLNNFDSGAADAVVLVAGHACGFSSVKLYNATTGQSATVSCSTSADLLGSTVTVATVAGGDLHISDGDEIWASAVDYSASGVTDGRTLRGVGQVIRWLLERSTIRFDMERAALLLRLDAFKADFFVNEPVSAYNIITDTILAGDLMPAYWRHASGGWFLAVQPIANEPVTARIDTSLGWTRDGGITCSPGSEVATDFSLSYADDAQASAALRLLRYAPVPTNGATVNPYCTNAFAALRVRRRVALEAPGVQDSGTARILLDHYVRRYTSTVRTASYTFQRPDTGIEVGAVVQVDDATAGIVAGRYWVISVTRSQTQTVVQVAQIPDPIRGGA